VVTAPQRSFVAARTSSEKKAKFAALAATRGMSESALLTLLMDTVLEHNDAAVRAVTNAETDPATERVTLRLRPGDRRRVDNRAAARNMKPASYLVALIRAHVRHDAPLPTAELNALKVAVGQLAAIGRNLNQLVHASHTGASAVGDLARTLHEAVAHVENVRRCVADHVRANLISWEAGDA
jgi:hypothetical protein